MALWAWNSRGNVAEIHSPRGQAALTRLSLASPTDLLLRCLSACPARLCRSLVSNLQIKMQTEVYLEHFRFLQFLQEPSASL